MAFSSRWHGASHFHVRADSERVAVEATNAEEVCSAA